MPPKKSIKTLSKEAEDKTAHFNKYKIDKSENNIVMNVFPGDTGQACLSEAYLDDVKIFKDHEGPVDAYIVGTNKNLKNKYLEVYSLVTDMPGEPNKTSFRFQLSGGILPYEYYTEKTVQSQGDSVVYKITIFFTIH